MYAYYKELELQDSEDWSDRMVRLIWVFPVNVIYVRFCSASV